MGINTRVLKYVAYMYRCD